jgi:hypothetical protein
MGMTKPTPDEVKKAIESSGYPLEIRVAHVLATRDYLSVIPSWDYRDDRTGEPREIDVVASRPFDVGTRGTHRQPVMVHLLIECKRSPAFVIYSAHPPTILTRDSDLLSHSYFGRPRSLWRKRETGFFGTDIVEHLKLGTLRWKWPDCVGIHYAFVQTTKEQPKPDRKKTPPRPQFKLGDEEFYNKKLLGLLKGAYMYCQQYVGSSTSEGANLVQPRFVIPILVMDADLYEYDVASASLRNIARGALCRSYQGEFSASFRIDVVQEQELVAYLEDLERDFSSLASQIGKQYSSWERALEHETEMSAKHANTDHAHPKNI